MNTATVSRPDRTGTGPTARSAPAGGIRPADLAVTGALLGLAALLPLPAFLRALLVAGFIALGPGSAVLTWVHIPVRARPATIPVLGMAISTIVTIAAMWSYRWEPHAILALGSVAVLAAGVTWRYRHGGTVPPGWWMRGRWLRLPTRAQLIGAVRAGRWSMMCSAAALLIWLAALPNLPGTDASYWGLVFSGTGPLLAVALVVCTAGFLIAVTGRQFPAAVVALATAITVSRMTTTLGAEMPLYDWAFKHIAVIDYILVNGVIQPNGTDIYAQWPSFFVVVAWFCEVTGLSPITVAEVTAPVAHVLIALTVFSAARVLRYSRRAAITAAYLVEIVNWVGQDYLSPQAWTLILAFGLLVLMLASPGCRAAGVLAIVLFAAMVPSHQLTPFWVLLTVCLLIVTRRARPWWAAVAMMLIAGGYLLLNLDAVAPYGLFSGGSVVDNAASNVAAVGSPAKNFTSAVCRSLSAVVLLSAAAAAVWQRLRGRPVLAPMLLAFSSFTLLLGHSYGGEAVFRVYLYALLGCGLLIAPAVVAALDTLRSRRRPTVPGVTVWTAMLAASVAGLHAYLALWPMVMQTAEQYELMDTLTAEAPPGSRFFMLHLGGMPARTNQYYAELTLADPYFDQPLSYDMVTGEKAVFPTDEQLGPLQWYAEQNPYRSYVLFSAQSTKAVQYYNEYRPEATEELKNYLRSAPGWKLRYENGETVVFEHPGLRGDGPAPDGG
ncbi:hypothetical protein [Mycolicibacterium thermoresistibile]